MTDVQFPADVENFIQQTDFFLKHFELQLQLKESNTGSQSRTYVVAASDGLVEVIVHRTASSIKLDKSEYRVRVIAPVVPEFSTFAKGKENFVNRVATLGALVDEASAVTCQCLVPEGDADVTAGLLALAISHGRESLIMGHVRAWQKEQAGQIETLSAWTDLDFEVADYDYAHLGSGVRHQRGWNMRYFGGALLSLDAVYNNPYWGGGLLVLLRIPKASIASPDRPLNADDLNKMTNIVGRTPTFGAWCEEDGDFVYVQFLPNFIKPLRNLTDQVITWASQRCKEVQFVSSSPAPVP